MSLDEDRYYVGRHFRAYAVYDLLITNPPPLSIHTTEAQAEQAAEELNAARRNRRKPTPTATQTALFNPQEVAN